MGLVALDAVAHQATMSKELSAVVADGLGSLFVHLLDVDLQAVLLGEGRRAHWAPFERVKSSNFDRNQ